jgi:hypothetical protein
MHAAVRRRLTLLDVIILVANTAAVLGLVRLDYLAYESAYGSGVRPTWWKVSLLVLVAMSLGALVLRLLPPRLRLRRLARQPGTLALIGILVTVVVASVDLIPEWLAPVNGGWALATVISLTHIALPSTLATGVVLGWGIGHIQGLHWRKADWVEWLGRAIGVAVVALWTLLTVQFFFK